MKRVYKLTIAFADRRKTDATLLLYETDHKTLTNIHNPIASFERTRLTIATQQYERGDSFALTLETILGVGYGKPTRVTLEALDIRGNI